MPKEGNCFHCNKPGHWRRNCPVYVEETRKNKGSMTSTSGIFVIEVNVSTSDLSSWVLDTGCGSHICGNVQGLRSRQTLARGEIDLRVGNGARIVALEVDTFDLVLPSGLVIELDNC